MALPDCLDVAEAVEDNFCNFRPPASQIPRGLLNSSGFNFRAARPLHESP